MNLQRGKQVVCGMDGTFTDPVLMNSVWKQSEGVLALEGITRTAICMKSSSDKERGESKA